MVAIHNISRGVGVVPLEQHTIAQVVVNLDRPVDGVALTHGTVAGQIDTGISALQGTKRIGQRAKGQQLHRHDQDQQQGQHSVAKAKLSHTIFSFRLRKPLWGTQRRIYYII